MSGIQYNKEVAACNTILSLVYMTQIFLKCISRSRKAFILINAAVHMGSTPARTPAAS